MARKAYVWYCSNCGGVDNTRKLKPCEYCHVGMITRHVWPARKTKANHTIRAMSSGMFGPERISLFEHLNWTQIEGYFIHKFKLRGKELKKFLELSKRWGNTSLT